MDLTRLIMMGLFLIFYTFIVLMFIVALMNIEFEIIFRILDWEKNKFVKAGCILLSVLLIILNIWILKFCLSLL
jgi:hypothetical protein